LRAGLGDPVHDAQAGFRAALQALSRPGTVQTLGWPIEGLALGGACASLLLALTDEDTPVWWQCPDAALAQWLRFHTGARVAAVPERAVFAVVTHPDRMPALDTFAQGSAQAPEFSATLLIEVPSLQGGPMAHAHGPGIRERQDLAVVGLHAGFWREWQANHAAFPQGVDVVFTCGEEAVGLPRTTRISRLQEV
jgi:alpha-D-ribose 1-methylphosphonate 5-triphosphate synthase subunit PhnH